MNRDELYAIIEKVLGEYVLKRLELCKSASELLCSDDLAAIRIYLEFYRAF